MFGNSARTVAMPMTHVTVSTVEVIGVVPGFSIRSMETPFGAIELNRRPNDELRGIKLDGDKIATAPTLIEDQLRALGPNDSAAGKLHRAHRT